MTSNAKTKIIILITLGVVFGLSPIFSNNLNFKTENSDTTSEYSDDITFDNENLKLSKISGKIHIDNNWTDAKTAGICTGNGTYSEPYIIEDLVIDGGGWGSCILIENSDVYFRIENCTLYYSGVGIRLSNTNHSQLINNNCSYNYQGIFLSESNNNTVSGNTANNNECGIYLNGNNNIISGNIADNNDWDGIILRGSNNTASGNIMNECGLSISGSFGKSCSFEELCSHDIDITNLVNEKPLYYYTNEVNLGPNDFTNAGQVILVNCNDSLISNLDISNGSFGISLYYCNDNSISTNTVSNNREGIYLNGDNNTVSGNTVNNNDLEGIYLNGNNNTVSGNIADNNDWYGIILRGSNNTASGNTVNNNREGIILDGNNNIISGNSVNNNDLGGIYCWASSYDNTIYLNCFTNNSYNAADAGSNNHWDNGIKGNYWSDYTGLDEDGNGIGDFPYNISIYVRSQDNFPLMKCPISAQNGEGFPLELIILISIIDGGAVIGVAALLLIRRKRKRIE